MFRFPPALPRQRWSLAAFGASLSIFPLYWFSRYTMRLLPVEGVSMQPTINPDIAGSRRRFSRYWNDLVYFTSVNHDTIKRGDVILARDPNPETTGDLIVKRVIALEGDTIRTLSYRENVVSIPPGHCWLEGDNHRNARSIDSNKHGPVPLESIVRKAAFVLHKRPLRVKRIDRQEPPRDRFLIIGTGGTSQRTDNILSFSGSHSGCNVHKPVYSR